MKYFGLTLMLKDDPAVIEKYTRLHREVYPEVVKAIRDLGITQMQTWILGNRLFMYVEAPDSFDSRDWARFVVDERTAEWDRMMRSMQYTAPEARPDEWWHAMEQVFDLNWPQYLPGS
jgi:L-rhamnose mutarotase